MEGVTQGIRPNSEGSGEKPKSKQSSKKLQNTLDKNPAPPAKSKWDEMLNMQHSDSDSDRFIQHEKYQIQCTNINNNTMFSLSHSRKYMLGNPC